MVGWLQPPSQPGRDPIFIARMFPYGQFGKAAGLLKWASGKSYDAYYGLATFRNAEPDTIRTGPSAGQIRLDKRTGEQVLTGKRTQLNAMAMKAFWIDLDCKRDGDKKPAGAVFPDRVAALRWLAGFVSALALPKPNMVVNSGYGIHAYWVMEDPMEIPVWQIYADAMRAAMIANGFVGDHGITADAARILRPPETLNHKVPPGAPVEIYPQSLRSGDIPNALMFAALAPFQGVAAIKTSYRPPVPGTPGAPALQGASTVSALAGGSNVASIFQGRTTPNMAAAAQANLPSFRKPSSFAKIAGECAQVHDSLTSHGAADNRNTWYLGHLTLAHFTTDGAQFVHAVGDHHPGYVAADTDNMVARVATEQAIKGNGPPTCAFYDMHKPGLCGNCPHSGKLPTGTPWELGWEVSDLPYGYRRGTGIIEHEVLDPITKQYVWRRLLDGDVNQPMLDKRPTGGLALGFTYTLQGDDFSIAVNAADIPTDAGAIFKLFEPMGISLYSGTEVSFRKFVVAWINLLRNQRKVRQMQTRAFGWAKNGPVYEGFATGGFLYRSGGAIERSIPGDKEILSLYDRSGDLDVWKKAAAMVAQGRPDFQAIIATSFGAPLMALTRYSGAVVSVWSTESGAGKSSAMNVAQTVWGQVKAMNALNDTQNAALHRVGELRALPAYFDETRISPDKETSFVDMIFSIAQGKGKARLDKNAQAQAIGEWDTILTMAANKSILEIVNQHTLGTEAGSLRVFEFDVNGFPKPAVSGSQQIIGAVRDHYGHAGHAYASYIAQNVPALEAMVATVMDIVATETKADQSERLFVAAVAAMLCGATLAKRLDLVPFDIPALKAFLFATFANLRAARQHNLLVGSTGYNLEEILGLYLTENMGKKLITDWLNATGGPSSNKVIWHPQSHDKVDIHIAQKDAVIRINKSAFTKWARGRGLSADEAVRQIVKKMGAVQQRATLGGGTGYGGASIGVLDIPTMNNPTLQGLLYVDPLVQKAAQQPTKGATP